MRIKLAIFAALIGIAFTLPGRAQLPQADHNPDANNTETPRTQKTDANPEEVAFPASKPDAESGSKNKEHECQYDGPQWFAGFYCFFVIHEKFWVAFGTVILAAVTLILGGATVFLYRATRALVQGAERTAERQLRAYVVVTGKEIRHEPGKFISDISILNTGQTPAHELRIVSLVTVLSNPPPKLFDFRLTNPDTPSVTVLGAGQKVGSSSTITPSSVPREEFECAIMDNAPICIHHYGTVTYLDVFGQPQWTNFCFAFDWSDTGMTARTTPYHNDASYRRDR